jgi:WD40 repeat protein
MWNIREQACIHSFESPGNTTPGNTIRSLFFAGGANNACVALTNDASIIRVWRAEGSVDFASETIGEADRGGLSFREAVFFPSGSFLATSFLSTIGDESTVTLHDIETMTTTQSVVMPRSRVSCVAVSPDSKQLVIGDCNGRIKLLQTDDFSIQRDFHTPGEAEAVGPVAFDPTCRVLAFGCDDGRLELRSL